jgi:hypothetical protein
MPHPVGGVFSAIWDRWLPPPQLGTHMIKDSAAGWDGQSHEIVDIYFDEVSEWVGVMCGGGR